MYSNMKYYENICNGLTVIQQNINRKLKSANCWQQTSLSWNPKQKVNTFLIPAKIEGITDERGTSADYYDYSDYYFIPFSPKTSSIK